MEAESFLSSGYGLRVAIQERAAGWQRLSHFADVWQPSRLKGIQVGPDFGIPFLAATQVYDIRAVPRKWLALEKTHEAQNRFVTDGLILVTCSGAVGRATLAHAPHENTLISHDLLRVTPKDTAQWGWIYAYLRSPQARAMMTTAKYGHMIKHLEIAHLDALPVPVVHDSWARKFNKQTAQILDLRNRAHQLSLDAEVRFERTVGALNVEDWGERGYTIRASAFFPDRRRFEGVFHNPGAAMIRRHLAKHGNGFTTLHDAGFDVWVPSRYKRIPADDGVSYYDSADLLEVAPDVSKRFADCSFGDRFRGRVKSGWLLMPSSGQVYGIIGSVVLAGSALDGQVVSNHVIRVAPREGSKMRNGYVLTALTHPRLGRPLIKALPFGSSVPEIDPAELENLAIVRLSAKDESAIADLAEEAASLRADADVQERALATASGELIDEFVAGNMLNFVTTMPAIHNAEPARKGLPEHTRVRLRRPLPEAGLPKGSAGTIVHVYDEGGYEVEFVEGRDRPAVVTVEPDDVEQLDGE